MVCVAFPTPFRLPPGSAGRDSPSQPHFLLFSAEREEDPSGGWAMGRDVSHSAAADPSVPVLQASPLCSR